MWENTNEQMFLFSDDPIRCFETFAGVDENFLEMISSLDLISFDYKENGVTEDRLLEILFLKNVIKSGFSFEKTLDMLAKLPKPYRYDLTKIYWDISTDKWKHVDETSLNQTENNEKQESTMSFTEEDEIIETLKDLKSLGDTEALTKIHNNLHDIIEDMN